MTREYGFNGEGYPNRAGWYLVTRPIFPCPTHAQVYKHKEELCCATTDEKGRQTHTPVRKTGFVFIKRV